MTTEPPTAPEPPPTPEPVPTVPTPAAPTVSGQMLLLVAAILIVGEYLIFGLIANEWYPGEVSLVAATVVLVFALMKNDASNAVLRIGGYVIAAAGLWNFLEGIRFGWDGFIDIVAWIVLALAAVLAFVGARSID
jgi:hypothetical protein